jgi:hypothetical protein
MSPKTPTSATRTLIGRSVGTVRSCEIPMALAGRGSFRTLAPTPHTLTNASVIQRFLDVPIDIQPETREVWRVAVGSGTTGAAS